MSSTAPRRTPAPTPTPAAATHAPVPAPRARPPRHNEWTRAKMAAFLRELAASQCVAHAARSVGMSRQAAYKLRNRLAGTPFALGWEVALEAGLQQLAHAVMDRALNGEEVPHYYHGELVGSSRRYDNRLAAWVLENPWRLGRQQLAREYSSEGFDRLVERVECASLDWEEGETLPGRIPPPLPEDEAQILGFLGEPDREEYPTDEDRDEAYRHAAMERDQGDFIAKRSWYAALAAETPARPAPRGRYR